MDPSRHPGRPSGRPSRRSLRRPPGRSRAAALAAGFLLGLLGLPAVALGATPSPGTDCTAEAFAATTDADRGPACDVRAEHDTAGPATDDAAPDAGSTTPVGAEPGCVGTTTTMAPGSPATVDSPVAITSQAFDVDVPGWARVGWEATADTTVSWVSIARDTGVELLEDGELGTGTAEAVAAITFCTEPSTDGGGQSAERSPDVGTCGSTAAANTHGAGGPPGTDTGRRDTDSGDTADEATADEATADEATADEATADEATADVRPAPAEARGPGAAERGGTDRPRGRPAVTVALPADTVGTGARGLGSRSTAAWGVPPSPATGPRPATATTPPARVIDAEPLELALAGSSDHDALLAAGLLAALVAGGVSLGGRRRRGAGSAP
jgi:hypothetical protein